MLTSLFGDLPPRCLPAPAATAKPAPTSIDVVVDASPAVAIRAHFASQRQGLHPASQMVTLLDPSRLWASQVLQALGEAAGQAVHKLHLRERGTLRTLAVIERTLVPRRDAPALRVYHADIRTAASTSGVAPEDITGALAEGSQLTAVIVGAMQPHALVALLRGLLLACHQPSWRCPHLVFILPPGAAALRQRILAQAWPSGVQAHALADPLGSVAQVWNCVLEAWETTQVASSTAAPSPAPPRTLAPPPTAARPPASPPVGRPSTVALNRLLLPLARSEGLLACGIIDLHTGDLLATQQREEPPTNLAGLAEALCAARLAHQAVAAGEAPPEEILVSSGPRQTLLRQLPDTLGAGVPLGFVAVLDRQQANLALLRFKLLDAERMLG